MKSKRVCVLMDYFPFNSIRKEKEKKILAKSIPLR